MKHTFQKLAAVMIAAAILLSLGLTAGAVERGGAWEFSSAAKGLIPNHSPAESLQTASEGGAPVGIFALEVETSEFTTCFTAFLLERDGNVYLITDTYAADVLAESKLTLKSSGNGGYSQKVSILGSDKDFVYLSASGLENFSCLPSGTQEASVGTMFVENTQNGEAAGLIYSDLDFSTMDIYTMNGTEDVAIFDIGSDPADIILGAPVVEQGTNQVVAIGSASKHPEDGNIYPVYYTILCTELEEAYALTAAGGQDNRDNKPDDGDKNRDNEDDYEDEEDYEDEGEPEETGEKKSGLVWILIAAAVAAAAFLIYRSRTQGGKPAALVPEQSEPAAIDETIPMDPGFDFVPMDSGNWQIRGVSGCFTGKTFPLSGVVRMGRSSQCRILFPNGTPGISSNHCELTLENGSILLTDLGSSYGTFTGSGKLTPNTPCFLKPGETFTLAQGESFLVEQAGAPVETGGITVRDAQGREYRTNSARMVFGRSQDCKVVLAPEDKSVSSSHCVLYRENGKLYLMDMGSTNGTFFTEENRLKPNTPYRIRKGMAFFLVSRKNTFVVVEA